MEKIETVVALLTLSVALAACERGKIGPSGEIVPRTVLTTVTINEDDTGPLGAQGRSLIVLDAEEDNMWIFPFTSMSNQTGGTAEGQPMHSALSLDKKRVYVTIGGDDTLPLRLVTVFLDWSGGTPEPTITDIDEILAAGNGVQQGHGTRMSPDGLFVMFSEWQNDRLRVFDTRTGEFVGNPITHASLVSPHGLWPSPDGTLAMSTQYAFDGKDVSIWDLDSGTGIVSFNKAVTLTDAAAAVTGAYSHTAAWLDNKRFYTTGSQETSQGDGSAQQSVFFVDAVAGTATAALAAWDGTNEDSGLREGISDLVIASGKLYVCEGNWEKTDPPGNISVWDITVPTAPAFIKRLGAGSGLPSDFLDCHGIFATPDGQFVFAQSFRSNHLIKVHTATSNAVKIWDESDGLSLPHGHYIQ